MSVCRYCSKAICGTEEESVTHSYWQGLPFPCHAACKADGERQEAIECQTIDGDCNDCRNYKRGKLAPLFRQMTKRTDGTMVEVTHQPNIFAGGVCLKFNQEMFAQPKKWTGMNCFEHRRTETRGNPSKSGPK